MLHSGNTDQHGNVIPCLSANLPDGCVRPRPQLQHVCVVCAYWAQKSKPTSQTSWLFEEGISDSNGSQRKQVQHKSKGPLLGGL